MSVPFGVLEAVQAFNKEYGKPLVEASKNGNVKAIEQMIEKMSMKKFDIDYHNGDGKTALYWAWTLDAEEIIDRLLDSNADPNIFVKEIQENSKPSNDDEKNSTPLIQATRKGDISMVKKLLNNKANPNIKDSEGFTALFWACFEENNDIVEILLNTNANPNICVNDENESPLILATKNENILLVKRLLENKADINHKGAILWDFKI